ncbi:hypothetical protein HK096_007364 [Nowakowskiella sp. JEL0078]|nr:hypothetical protein HK096_007364 [Nowakowskiella sp. JEL0078]
MHIILKIILFIVSILPLLLTVITHTTNSLFISYDQLNTTLLEIQTVSQNTLTSFSNSHTNLTVGFWYQCQGNRCWDVDVPGCGLIGSGINSVYITSQRTEYISTLNGVCRRFNIARGTGISTMCFAFIGVITLLVAQAKRSGVGKRIFGLALFSFICTVISSTISVIYVTLLKSDIDILGKTAKIVNDSLSNTDNPYFNTFYDYSFGFALMIAAAAMSIIFTTVLVAFYLTEFRSKIPPMNRGVNIPNRPISRSFNQHMERPESGRPRMLGNNKSILQNSVKFAEEIRNSRSSSFKSSDFKTCENEFGDSRSDSQSFKSSESLSNSISLSLRSLDSRSDSRSDSRNSQSLQSSDSNVKIEIDVNEILHPSQYQDYALNSRDSIQYVQRSNNTQRYSFNRVDPSPQSYANELRLSQDYVNRQRFSQIYETPQRFSQSYANTQRFSQNYYAPSEDSKLVSQSLTTPRRSSPDSQDTDSHRFTIDYSDPENFSQWPSHTRATSSSNKPPSGSPVVPPLSPFFFDALRPPARNPSPSGFVENLLIETRTNERRSEDDILREEHIDNWIEQIDSTGSRASTSSFVHRPARHSNEC